MQLMGINWQVFGWTLAGAFIFGIFFARVVRWAARKYIFGQTAWAVVVGDAATLAFMIPLFGIQIVAIVFCYFIASGIPMIVEYVLRVNDLYQKDTQNAQTHAKDLLTK